MSTAGLLPLPLWLLAFFSLSVTTVAVDAANWSKIDRNLYGRFNGNKEKIDVMVTMMNGTEGLLEFTSSQIYETREVRLNAVAAALKSHRDNVQVNLLAFLASTPGVEYTSFWINNQVSIKKAPLELVEMISSFEEVKLISEEEIATIVMPKVSSVVHRQPGVSLAEPAWGVSKIQADRVWGTAGHTGVGVVVGLIDTGVRGTHQNLRLNYRTPYGWRDPSFTDINATPDDANGHGTHCLGTILGSNGIGVAPGAQWAACKGCRSSFCLQSDLVLCGEWMLCPSLPDGSQQDCSKAPHLVSNSWAGGQGNAFYNEIIAAWKAGGIVPIFAQGNSGPTCTSAMSPGDADVIGVGATDSNDFLASFSSKGPSILGTLKPDISAPGVDVYSSYHTADNSYSTLSGTSMAAPHVAGAVALMLSRRPNMTYAEIKQSLFTGSDTSSLVRCTYDCGGIPGSTYPNNCYGHGRLNVYNSISNIQLP